MRLASGFSEQTLAQSVCGKYRRTELIQVSEIFLEKRESHMFCASVDFSRAGDIPSCERMHGTTSRGFRCDEPIAAPIVGGMITSTIAVLILASVLFALMKEHALSRGRLRGSEPAGSAWHEAPSTDNVNSVACTRLHTELD